MPQNPFAVAVELDGAHPAAWADRQADALSPRRLAAAAQTADRFGFTAATFDDSPVPTGAERRLDAIQRAAFAAPQTSALGLIPVAHVAFSEPFHVATQLASLDWASGGRAGWIAAASGAAREAAAFGRSALDEHELRRERDDVIEVARRLWDSWEDDAVIRDLPTGRYLDRDKLHYVDFQGARFSVKGPSITPRPPQGQLVVAAEPGTADIDIALVRGRDAGSVGAAATSARAAGAALVWAEIDVVLDARGATGTERLTVLEQAASWPDRDRLRYTGDAGGLVELIATLAAHVDGVRLLPATLDADLDELGRIVLPALRGRIGFRSPLAGDSLRRTLGLSCRANRYAAATAPASATASAPAEKEIA